jgi:hypothetical protein
LKQDIAGAIVGDYKNNVALPVGFVGLFSDGRKSAEINAAEPIVRDREFIARFPSAFMKGFFAGFRSRLLDSLDGIGACHQAGTFAAVVAGAKELDFELASWLSGNVDR